MSLTFEEERDLLKRLNPYEAMLTAVSWASGFTYALRHPDAEQLMDADVASSEALEGFARARQYQQHGA